MPIRAAEIDRLFDEGGDISEHIDWSKATRPNREARRVNGRIIIRRIKLAGSAV